MELAGLNVLDVFIALFVVVVILRGYNPREHPRLRRARGGHRQDDRRFDQEPSLQPDFRDAGRIWRGGARVCALPRAGVGRWGLRPPVTTPPWASPGGEGLQDPAVPR